MKLTRNKTRGMLGKIRNLLKPKALPAVSDIHSDCSELKDFAEEFRKRQVESFGEVEKNLDRRTVRISRFLYDNENDILDVFERIRAVPSVSGRKTGKSLTGFVLGGVSVFALAASVVYSLLRVPGGVLFVPLLLSVVSLSSTLIFILCAVSRISGRGRDFPEVSFKIAVPEEERRRFFQEDCAIIEEKLREQISSIDSMLNKPENHEEGALDSLSEVYCGLYEAEKMGKYGDVSGWIMPQCARMLKDSGLCIVDSYDEENRKFFTVLEAPQSDGSFVLKPAVVRKRDGVVIQSGQYVKGRR